MKDNARTRVKAPRLRKGSIAPFAVVRGKGVKEVLEFRVLGHRATFDLSAKMAIKDTLGSCGWGGTVADKVGSEKPTEHAFSYVATSVVPSALFASKWHPKKLSMVAKGNK